MLYHIINGELKKLILQNKYFVFLKKNIIFAKNIKVVSKNPKIFVTLLR